MTFFTGAYGREKQYPLIMSSKPVPVPPLIIRGARFDPPFFCAPMAGITHSAFRRLVSDSGEGYGALWTEMLSASALVHENLSKSPYTKKRPQEQKVVYQLLLDGTENTGAVVDSLSPAEPAGLDINLACPAPEIVRRGSGAALFADIPRMETVLRAMRKQWNRPLFAKVRLGPPDPGWRDYFSERIRVLEACGIDALTVHPRFSDEKLKRRARRELFPWICSLTQLPVIANGDIRSLSIPEKDREKFDSTAGLMIGRMAVVKPWIFAHTAGNSTAVDYAEVWIRFFTYLNEDFPPGKALGRLKEFTTYYARNFFFGHELYRAVQSAPSLEIARERAVKFLASNPQLTEEPSVAGI